MSHYDVLGVAPDATQSEIENAFQRLTQAYHSGEDLDRARATLAAKAVAEAYHILRDPKRRREYNARLEWLEKPVENPDISIEEVRAWAGAGGLSQGVAARIEAARLRRAKEEREREERELAIQQSRDDTLRAVGRILGVLFSVLIGVGALWLIVSLVRHFWIHPLF